MIWFFLFKFHYSISSLRSSCGCLRLLPRHFIFSIIPSVTCFKRQCLRKNKTRIPILMYEYIPVGRRKVIGPKKRWRDQHPLRRNKPENGFTLSLLVMSTNYEAPQYVIISIALFFFYFSSTPCVPLSPHCAWFGVAWIAQLV